MSRKANMKNEEIEAAAGESMNDYIKTAIREWNVITNNPSKSS